MTVLEQRFYEVVARQLPQICENLEKIANELKRLNDGNKA